MIFQNDCADTIRFATSFTERILYQQVYLPRQRAMLEPAEMGQEPKAWTKGRKGRVSRFKHVNKTPRRILFLCTVQFCNINNLNRYLPVLLFIFSNIWYSMERVCFLSFKMQILTRHVVPKLTDNT